MAYDLASIQKGRRDLPPRMILLGTEKIGKSTFAADAPNPIFLPIRGEEGIDALDCAKFPTVHSFMHLMEALGSLAEEGHDFKTVVIDSTSALEPLVWEHTCIQNEWNDIESAGYGRGYVKALQYWQQLQECLDYLRNEHGIGSILIGHVTVSRFNDPTTESYDTYQFDINSKASAQLMRWSDCILFANRRTFVRKEKAGIKREEKVTSGGEAPMLYTQKRPGHPGGGRGVYGQLPYELPLDYPTFEAAVAAAS